MISVEAPATTSRPMTPWPAFRSLGARKRPSQPEEPVNKTRMRFPATGDQNAFAIAALASC
jgi:hypothetical protein